MSLLLYACFFFGDLLLAHLISRSPEAFARFARIPVREPITLRVPPGVEALVFPLRDDAATYRVAPERGIALSSLPGKAHTERDNFEIRFMPDTTTVLASPRARSTSLVRVEITRDGTALKLRASRLPNELAWTLVCAIAFARMHSFHRHVWSIGVLTFVAIMISKVASARARMAFEAVTSEMRVRLGVANGDPPSVVERSVGKPPVVRKLTGEEWTCACGKVNKMKKTMCGRCWAQRPGEP